MVMTAFLDLFPTSFQEFASYPGFWERVVLLLSHLPVIVILLGGLVVLQMKRFNLIRAQAYRIGLCVWALLPLLVRVAVGYAYDTPVGLLCLLSDIAALGYFAVFVASKLLKTASLTSRLVGGLAFLLILSTALTIFGFQTLAGTPKFYLHSIFSICLVFRIWNIKFVPLEQINAFSLLKKHWLIILVCILPFLPNVFTPAVPDADITSMTEITGYLFQGQHLTSVATGVLGENLSIAYPAGMPSLMWSISHLMNVWASEAALILWYFCYVLVVLELVKLARVLNINTLLTALFALNLSFTGMFGLVGGQVQELLAYAFGIEVVVALILGGRMRASLCLCACMLLHPVVALPFCLALAVVWSIKLFQTKTLLPFIMPGFILISPFLYLMLLSMGPRIEPSQPSILLATLTPKIFFTNILKCLRADTFSLYGALLVIPLASVFGLQRQKWFIILVWLFGALLIDGLFGHTLWIARFQASLSTVGPWVLSIALIGSFAETRGSAIPYFRQIVVIVAVLLWGLQVAPGFRLIPGSVFTTHSDIRMGRYIEDKLDENVLIANIKPHGDYGDRYYEALAYNSVRGDCARDTLFARIGPHQAKSGTLIDRRAYYQALRSSTNEILGNLGLLGVTHVLVSARPGVRTFIDAMNQPYLHHEGDTYLFVVGSR
jgi:hypothetical protein